MFGAEVGWNGQLNKKHIKGKILLGLELLPVAVYSAWWKALLPASHIIDSLTSFFCWCPLLDCELAEDKDLSLLFIAISTVPRAMPCTRGGNLQKLSNFLLNENK